MKLPARRLIPIAVLAPLALAALGWLSCIGGSRSMPQLGKLSLRLPPPPTATAAAPQASASPPDAGPTEYTGSVFDAREQGCTTKIVEGLSRQILAEGNCIAEGAFVPLPELANLELDESVLPFLSRPARDALVELLGEFPADAMRITSMVRTLPQQYLLHEWYAGGRCGVTLAAKPGASNHESGLAVDVSSPAPWRKRLGKAGFRWLGKRDRWHFDYSGSKAKRYGRTGVQAFQRLWNRNHPDDPIRDDGDYDETTEARLRQAPANGFAEGPTCPAASATDAGAP
jgi:hypothetical protein